MEKNPKIEQNIYGQLILAVSKVIQWEQKCLSKKDAESTGYSYGKQTNTKEPLHTIYENQVKRSQTQKLKTLNTLRRKHRGKYLQTWDR